MSGLVRQVTQVLVLALVSIMLVVQIRKSVRKKHTLPAYKLRYQPFFTMPSTAQGLVMPAQKDIYVSGQKLNVGELHVYVLNCTRLIQLSADDPSVYCTISIGNCLYLLLILVYCDRSLPRSRRSCFGLLVVWLLVCLFEGFLSKTVEFILKYLQEGHVFWGETGC